MKLEGNENGTSGEGSGLEWMGDLVYVSMRCGNAYTKELNREGRHW
jgi:hypothetical protein